MIISQICNINIYSEFTHPPIHHCIKENTETGSQKSCENSHVVQILE